MKPLFFALSLLLTLGIARAETITLEHQGLEVSAELRKANDEWQSGKVFLLLHGTLAHNRMEIIATLQDGLADQGYSSLAINLSYAQSGRSGMADCAVPHRHLHTDALDETGLWLDWLEQQGAGQIILLGHSRGGNQIARFAAERDRHSIERIILVAPQTWVAGRDETAYTSRYGKSLVEILDRAEQLIAADKGDELLEPVDFIYCAKTAATARALVSYYRPDPRMDTPGILHEISKPVLVVAGSDDTTVSDIPQRMAAVETGTNVELISIDGADHFFMDLYADDLASVVVEFAGR